MKNLFIIALILVLYSCSKESITDTSGTKGSSDYALLSGGTMPGTTGTSVIPGNGDSLQVDAGVITAAEWNDLNHWDFWKDLMGNKDFNQYADLYTIYPVERYSIQVTGTGNLPMIDVPVELMSDSNVVWKCRTDNKGMAECWKNLFVKSQSIGGEQINVKVNGTFFVGNIHEISQGVNQVQIPDLKEAPKLVEIAFMVDATGSMSDELEYLKKEILDVINRIKNNNQALSIRMGAVFYRDEGDQYITRVSQFSSDINETTNFIKDQSADGGGDTPEAVHMAFDKTVNELDWSDHAVTRIVFMVLDAPPHDEALIYSSIHSSLTTAAEKGIKIIPISGSGIDKQTEFLLRFFSIASNGTYVFITNDSGIGNDHIAATVGDYKVEYLNDLMVRLVTQYTAAE